MGTRRYISFTWFLPCHSYTALVTQRELTFPQDLEHATTHDTAQKTEDIDDPVESDSPSFKQVPSSSRSKPRIVASSPPIQFIEESDAGQPEEMEVDELSGDDEAPREKVPSKVESLALLHLFINASRQRKRVETAGWTLALPHDYNKRAKNAKDNHPKKGPGIPVPFYHVESGRPIIVNPLEGWFNCTPEQLMSSVLSILVSFNFFSLLKFLAKVTVPLVFA